MLPEETASAAGLQNFVRTISLAIATALALTIADNTTQAAHVELADKLQPEDTMRTLSEAGMSSDEAMRTIANIVDREAVMIGVDYIFLITAVVFFLSAAVIWLAPRPKKSGR